MKLRILAVVALALALASCARKHPAAPVAAAPAGPAATTPVGAVQRLAWAMVSRDVAAYTELLTDDFKFQLAPNDSAGNSLAGRCMDRTQEEAAMQHLFVSGGTAPPASDIRLTISNMLVAQPDPRSGMTPRWHRSVRTPMDLRLTCDEGGIPQVSSITGYALFFVVRGDSAFFLPARAAEHDSTRWFISRWEDETAGASGSPGTHGNPTRQSTLGSVKVRYLDAGASAP
jgi:hypothetical protein